MTVRTGPLPAAENKRDMPFLCAQDSGDLDLHSPCGHARSRPRCRVYAEDPLHRSRIRRHRSPLPGVRGRPGAESPRRGHSHRKPGSGTARSITPTQTRGLPADAGGQRTGMLCFQKSGLFPQHLRWRFSQKDHTPGISPPCFSGPWSHHCGEPTSR